VTVREPRNLFAGSKKKHNAKNDRRQMLQKITLAKVGREGLRGQRLHIGGGKKIPFRESRRTERRTKGGVQSTSTGSKTQLRRSRGKKNMPPGRLKTQRRLLGSNEVTGTTMWNKRFYLVGRHRLTLTTKDVIGERWVKDRRPFFKLETERRGNEK